MEYDCFDKHKNKRYKRKRFNNKNYNDSKSTFTARCLNLGFIHNGNLLKQDWNIHWQLNLAIGVFLRDSLLNFANYTQVFPTYDSEFLDEIYSKYEKGIISEKEYDYLSNNKFKEWQNKIREFAFKFDNFIKANKEYECEFNDESRLKLKNASEKYKQTLIEFAEFVNELEW